MAYGVWDIANEKGMRIPQDISLIGMDDLAESAQRGLTSIRYSCEEVGRLAVKVMVSLMQGGVTQLMNSVVPVELVPRSSVASPP
jgi:DNA-binding LacI/PurR family transcriptional regulator